MTAFPEGFADALESLAKELEDTPDNLVELLRQALSRGVLLTASISPDADDEHRAMVGVMHDTVISVGQASEMLSASFSDLLSGDSMFASITVTYQNGTTLTYSQTDRPITTREEKHARYVEHGIEQYLTPEEREILLGDLTPEVVPSA